MIGLIDLGVEMLGRKLNRRQWLAERMDRLCDRKIRRQCRINELKMQFHEDPHEFQLIMIESAIMEIYRIDRELAECQTELARIISAELATTC